MTHFGLVVFSIIVDYIVCVMVAPTSKMKFQVKVEYVKDKWMTFMVSSRLVSSAEYHFKDLVEDITSRCTTLNYLNEMTVSCII